MRQRLPHASPAAPVALLALAAALLPLLPAAAVAEEAAVHTWPHWRGPHGNGVSHETGLPASWSPEGENLVWRKDFTGRSTPVVFDGKVCANGRFGEDATRQEMVACFDAETGEKLWERRYPVYHTTVPWNRVGWANPTADPETGYLYVQGVGGLFFCLDADDGSVVWSKNLYEEYGFMEGYGGRTQTPLVDGERLIVTFANNSWGDQRIPRHRLWAFDKRTGEPLWVSSPASSMADKNTQSTPGVLVVDGRRMYVHGNGDGWIYAVDAATGEKVWGFHLSQRGINTSPLVDGTTVYAAHSEENIDEGTMGRVVAIDGTGTGDVTETHEKWRADLGVGFSTPLLHAGRLYVVSNSADLYALDAETGEEIWELSLGRVGKGSPVWADGKIYVGEVNGHFVIVEPAESPEAGEPRILDRDLLEMPEGRYAEIYGSPAVGYGRVFFTTEEGIYALGDPERPFPPHPGTPHGAPEDPAAAVAAGEPGPARTLLVIPKQAELAPGESVDFRVEAYDAKGRQVPVPGSVAWSLDGLDGTVADGRFTPAADAPSATGTVAAKAGDLAADARVRVVRPLPLREDFESYEAGQTPSYLLHGVTRFEVADLDGDKVLAKGPSPAKLDRHHTFLGSTSMSGYTIEADVMGTQEGRRVPDVGLLASGYALDLQSAQQRLQLRSWPSELRSSAEIPFEWELGKWYRMKLHVDATGDGARVRGKVWPKGEPEPEAWTIELEDPIGIESGAPGLIAYSPSFVYYDDVVVTKGGS